MINFKEYLKENRTSASDAAMRLALGEIDTRDLMTANEANQRKHLKVASVLNDLIVFLDDIEKRPSSNSIISILRRMILEEDYEMLIKEIDRYMYVNDRNISEAIKCSNCKCIKCPNTCSFKACYYCTSNSKVIACDKQNNCVTDSARIEKLYVAEKNRYCDFEIVGKLTQINNKDYLYLRDKNDYSNEQLIEYDLDIRGNEKFIPLSEEKLDEIYQVFLDLKVVN